jgi:hypothetical protein
MNRREFIKASIPAAVIPAVAITCKYEDDEKGPEKESSVNWNYRVYCYERNQGEWTFSQNVKGSFAYQREYMTPEEDQGWPYAGWMDQGKLHFASLDDATNFIDCHVRTKDDVNLIDSIYDVYFVNKEGTEINVAHYWFNGDTGRQIHWVADKPYTDYSKVEFA